MTDYADIAVTSQTWTQVPAATEKVTWQIQGRPVRLSTKSAPSGDTGTLFAPGEGIDISAGKAVWYRGTGKPAKISREAF